MAIIYSYENNNELLRSDKLVGTAATLYNGKFRRITKNFTLGQLSDFINLQFTNNIEEWVTDNFVPKVRTLSINGVTYDLSANRSWTVDAGGGNLQEVTDEGNTTNNSMIIRNDSLDRFLAVAKSSKDVAIFADKISYTSNGEYSTQLLFEPTLEYAGISVRNIGGTVALTSDIGTWGALNYPTWTAGTPFVKMTAAGTFALDTNTYLTSITSSDVITALGYTPVTNARTLTINGITYDLSADRNWAIASGVTSVGMTVPSAFNVTPSTITSSGTFAITGAGSVSQYVRGDGTLANFPTSTGGGASVSYYLNGSISQGTIGGVEYKEMNSVPVIGAGTDFTINTNGYIAQFITDAGDPNKLLIPAGNWNFETYFSASSGGGTPRFYIELYKYDGSVFTLIASNSASPKLINDGTSIEAYFSTLAVPPTTLLATDRLAVRFYVINSGRTITMHTENSHLCQVITTFSTGLTALNGLTQQVQNFAVGTSGTDFNISSATNTHTFNLPNASATARGVVTTGTQTFEGAKTFNVDATINSIRVGRGGGNNANNVVIGNNAFGTANASTTNTVVIGANAMPFLGAGAAYSNNTAVGASTLGNNGQGANNTAIGQGALFRVQFTSNNVAVGVSAGSNTNAATSNTGPSNSVYIGNNTTSLANNNSNQIVIGDSTQGNGSNTITLGNTSIVDTFLRGRVRIQQYTTATRPAYVKGAIIFDTTLNKLVVGGVTTWEVITSI
jgi:hypothetical protein